MPEKETKAKEEEVKEKASLEKVFQGVKDKISEISTSFWMGGWLFTIGFAGLKGWTLVWALLLWPYYFGDKLNDLLFK